MTIMVSKDWKAEEVPAMARAKGSPLSSRAKAAKVALVVEDMEEASASSRQTTSSEISSGEGTLSLTFSMTGSPTWEMEVNREVEIDSSSSRRHSTDNSECSTNKMTFSEVAALEAAASEVRACLIR
jgi:hypothetical protein